MKQLKDWNKIRMITGSIRKQSINNNSYEDYNKDK